ncbi:MAG: hypothetical protein IAF38_21210, partial [Bacteroidia bacterium]|nr:hypothetical protein [Bacteroidia bacterium]
MRNFRFHTKEARELIEAGADANCNCHYKEVSSNDLISRIFQGYKTYVNYIDISPVEICFKGDSVALLDYFVKHGAKLDSVDISQTCNLEMWKYLFGKGFTVNDFRFVLLPVVRDKERIQFLLDKGLDINKPLSKNNETISMTLASVIEEDDTTLFHYLVSKGADIN